MSRVCLYGKAPYQVVVVHGGPGAPGSITDMARELGKEFGVVEPIQSKCSIEELVEELKEQLEATSTENKVILIGHSFGAWLAAIYASRYSERVEKLILVGCAPLDAAYTKRINEYRKIRLSDSEQKEFEDILNELEHRKEKQDTKEQETVMERLGELIERTDNYLTVSSGYEDTEKLPTSGEIYGKVWPEAARLRETGELMEAFLHISCPIVFIQGEEDPHPIIGIEEPLKRCGVPYICHHLKKCGHTPWRELYARKEFYQIINREIVYEIEPI